MRSSEAVDYARTIGAVVVAAAGNSGTDAPVYPAAYPGVLGVAAVDRDGTPWAGSNRGAHVSLAAPGVDILTTGLDGDWISVTGTSPATAHVAVAGLMTAAHLDATGSQVEEALLRTTEDVGEAGRDHWSGSGIVRAERVTQVSVTRLVDVSVNRVMITPSSFEIADTVSIAVAISNLGTDVVDIPTITVTANGRVVATEAGSGTFAPGESATVTLNWVVDILPGSEELVVEASASPTAGETNLANNHRQVRSTYDPIANVYVLYKEVPFVHSWVALQAYNILPAGPLKSELAGYLWGDTSYDFLFNAGKVWWNQYAVPKLWGDGAAGKALLEGAMEEDTEKDTIAKAHFWNPDVGYNAGIVILGQTQQSNLARAQEQFAAAVSSYSANNKEAAYYRLGRVAHLLGDLAVPEHVHNDPHTDGFWFWTPNDFSNYEDYTKLNYRSYSGSGSPKSISSLPLAFPTYPDRPSSYDLELGRLFSDQAEATQHFDSSGRERRESWLREHRYRHSRPVRPGRQRESVPQRHFQPRIPDLQPTVGQSADRFLERLRWHRPWNDADRQVAEARLDGVLRLHGTVRRPDSQRVVLHRPGSWTGPSRVVEPPVCRDEVHDGQDHNLLHLPWRPVLRFSHRSH